MLRGTARTVRGSVALELFRPGQTPSDTAIGGEFQVHQKGVDVEVDPIAADLMEISAGIYLADRSVRRSMRSGQPPRVFHLRIGVTDPDRWESVRPHIEALADFASQDLWRLRFVRRRIRRLDRPENPRCDVVALFSGGLDSTCGAAHLARRDLRALLLTHSPPGTARVEALVAALAPRLPEGLATASISIAPRQRDMAGRRTRFQEFTRRTRPFLYLALASAAAIVTGAREVQMSENGALGASLPFRRSHYGPRITRQGHARMLDGFEALLAAVMPDRPAIRFVNPFAHVTKGEACTIVDLATKAAHLTLSCEYVGQQIARLRAYFRATMDGAGSKPEARQCGLCVPCVVRRAALHRAGIDDPDSDYFFDAAGVWRGHKPIASRADTKAPPLFDFVGVHPLYAHHYAQSILEMDSGGFAGRFFNELSSLRPPISSAHDLSVAFDLQRRFAHELLAFLDG